MASCRNQERPRFLRDVFRGQMPNRDGFAPFLPDRLVRIIRKALQVNPDDRYTSALQMRRELEQCPINRVWEFDPSGGLECRTHNNLYQLQEIPMGSNSILVQLRKINLRSERSTLVNKFKKICRNNNEMKDFRRTIFQWVLNNG